MLEDQIYFTTNVLLRISSKHLVLNSVWLLWRHYDMRPHKNREIRFPVLKYKENKIFTKKCSKKFILIKFVGRNVKLKNKFYLM